MRHGDGHVRLWGGSCAVEARTPVACCMRQGGGGPVRHGDGRVRSGEGARAPSGRARATWGCARATWGRGPRVTWGARAPWWGGLRHRGACARVWGCVRRWHGPCDGVGVGVCALGTVACTREGLVSCGGACALGAGTCAGVGSCAVWAGTCAAGGSCTLGAPVPGAVGRVRGGGGCWRVCCGLHQDKPLLVMRTTQKQSAHVPEQKTWTLPPSLSGVTEPRLQE